MGPNVDSRGPHIGYGWSTKSTDYPASARTYLIDPSYEIHSEEELKRGLCRLFQSAYRNEVPLGPTWVCEYEDRPDLEVICVELADR